MYLHLLFYLQEANRKLLEQFNSMFNFGQAVQSNQETKLASLNIGDNGIGPIGAKAVAAMVAAIPSLTSVWTPALEPIPFVCFHVLLLSYSLLPKHPHS